MIQDLRFVFRSLRKTPGFTVIAVITLALGIGASTAIFSLVDAVLLRPLALPGPAHLVSLREAVPALAAESLPVNAHHYVTWRSRANSFTNLALLAPTTIALTGADEPRRLNIAYTTGSLFPTLGVAPSLGRTFSAEEETEGHNQVVILTDSFWRRQYQAAPDIIGRTVMLDQVAHTVIGVLPSTLRFPDLRPQGPTPPGFTEPDLFKPKYFPAEELAETFGRHNYTVIARLRPGVTPDRAQQELSAIGASLAKEAGVPFELRAIVTPLQEMIVRGTRRNLLVLLASVTTVLLIGSVNLASMLLARMEHRRSEATLRQALGASQRQLLRLALLEPFCLAVLGGALGLFLASVAIDLFPHLVPSDLPRLAEVKLNGAVFGFALLLTTASGLLAGLIPAWRLSRGAPGAMLATSGRTLAGSSRTGRSQRLLLTVQIALSVVLLGAAGLLSRSFLRLTQAEQGYTFPGAIAAEITAPFGKYRTDPQRVAFYDRLLDRLSATPGISAAAISSLLPLQGETWVDRFGVPGDGRKDEERPSVNTRFISADYFRVIGLRVQAGRLFSAADRTRKVAIISRQLAAVLWPGRDPVGQSIARNENDVFEVIGVVADVRVRAGDKPVPTIYRQFTDWPHRTSFLVVSTGLDVPAAVAALRSTLRAVDPDVPMVSIRTLAHIADAAVAPQRFQTGLAVSFAITAALLTALGLFGVVTYAVACREREFGVRLALGAAPGALPVQVLRQYLIPVLAGLSLGLGLFFASGKLLSGLLYETSPHDPLILGAVSLLVIAVSAASAWLPARRATQVDPMVALRAE